MSMKRADTVIYGGRSQEPYLDRQMAVGKYDNTNRVSTKTYLTPTTLRGEMVQRRYSSRISYRSPPCLHEQNYHVPSHFPHLIQYELALDIITADITRTFSAQDNPSPIHKKSDKRCAPSVPSDVIKTHRLYSSQFQAANGCFERLPPFLAQSGSRC